MKRSVKWAVVAAASVSVLAAGFIGGRAWAGGIPTAGALTYSGVLQKVDGSPLTSTGHNLEIKLWSTGPTGGTALCDTTVPVPTFTLDNSGRFSVQLDNSCTGAIGANAGAWVEILLDGNTLNRTRLGAVPYAIEANHAVSADTATIAAAANAAAGALSTTIGNLQQQIPVVSYVENTGGVIAPADGTWVNLPGLTVSFQSSAAAHAELYIVAGVTAGTSQTASCSLRFVLDGAAIGGSEVSATVNGSLTPPSIVQLTGFRRVAVAAGAHSVLVQISKDQGTFAGSTCVFGGVTSGAIGRLRVTVQP